MKPWGFVCGKEVDLQYTFGVSCRGTLAYRALGHILEPLFPTMGLGMELDPGPQVIPESGIKTQSISLARYVW